MNVLNNEHLLNVCVFYGAGISYRVTKRCFSGNSLMKNNKLNFLTFFNCFSGQEIFHKRELVNKIVK
ncbi:hypothetical protein DSN37_01875 [Salmonella enterica subsp. enterica serovar Kuessel]|nr:hypothetical protein [Salmonella enterica subsp. enterica serovar Kuessel]ECF3151857.1 hypothetical protein [Salmonella enterica subsp. enterica serovar Volkmarsdorf]